MYSHHLNSLEESFDMMHRMVRVNKQLLDVSITLLAYVAFIGPLMKKNATFVPAITWDGIALFLDVVASDITWDVVVALFWNVSVSFHMRRFLHLWEKMNSPTSSGFTNESIYDTIEAFGPIIVGLIVKLWLMSFSFVVLSSTKEGFKYNVICGDSILTFYMCIVFLGYILEFAESAIYIKEVREVSTKPPVDGSPPPNVQT